MISFLREIWAFLRIRKKYWLAPVIIMMMLVGLLLMLTESAATPFIYTLF